MAASAPSKVSEEIVAEDAGRDMRLALELDVPTDVRLIERVVTLVSRQVQALDFPASVCTLNVPVALSEALSNAMLRGNRDDPSKHVRIRADVDRHALVLEIADEGAGFDLDRCTKDPTSPGNMLREDGRGLFLMRRLMDQVERYSEVPEARGGAVHLMNGTDRSNNVVRLTLRRP